MTQVTGCMQIARSMGVTVYACGSVPGDPLNLTPLTSAGERSSRALRSLEGSMLVGPPLEYTPVYRDCSNIKHFESTGHGSATRKSCSRQAHVLLSCLDTTVTSLCNNCSGSQKNLSLYQIGLTQRRHCSQNAVIGHQLGCPDMKNVPILCILIVVPVLRDSSSMARGTKHDSANTNDTTSRTGHNSQPGKHIFKECKQTLACSLQCQ